MNNYVARIIEKFGGTKKMAEAVNYPATTINSWKMRGAIHDEHKPIIRERAASAGVILTAEDFFPEAGPTAAR